MIRSAQDGQQIKQGIKTLRLLFSGLSEDFAGGLAVFRDLCGEVFFGTELYLRAKELCEIHGH